MVSQEIEAFRFWARSKLLEYSRSVAYIVTTNNDGEENIGSGFHVGDGVLVTARHVVENRAIVKIGFDNEDNMNWGLLAPPRFRGMPAGKINIVTGPHFHSDQRVDVACFKIDPYPEKSFPLGGHLDDYLGKYELVLHRTLLLGYPPIPLVIEPTLVASVGEVNAIVDLYVGCQHPHFIISTMARGGFSGAPVLVAYNENNQEGGTAVLGIVTQSLSRDYAQPEQGYLAVLTVEPIYDCLKQHGLLPASQRIDISEDGG